MNKITTGLAVATLAALTLGAASPAVAARAPDRQAGTPAVPAESTTTAGDATPRIAFIETAGDRYLSIGGIAQDMRLVGIEVEGEPRSGIPVQDGRFSTLVHIAHLGKKAKLLYFTSQGEQSMDFVLELGYADGEGVAPGQPVVHGVSTDDEGYLVIEGTVSHSPELFAKPEVWADIRGVSWDFPAENGSFSLRVPASYAGQIVDVKSSYRGHFSEVTPVEMVVTETNTASEAFPLEVESPAAGDLVTPGATVFTGSAIPNSEIVVTRDDDALSTDSALCETRVTSSGDWSCTSTELPAGNYSTTVTETPTWQSAPVQHAGASFAVDDSELLPSERPVLPMLWSSGLDRNGDLVVRVIAHNAAEARIEVGGVTQEVRGAHGRFAFTLDPELLGETATITGVRGATESPSLTVPLTAVEAPAASPVTAPLVHGISQATPESGFRLAVTSDYFPDEYRVPYAIARIDNVLVGSAMVTWNGAQYLHIPAEHAGKQVEIAATVGDGVLSAPTTVVLEPTEGNTAPETFPLAVTSIDEDAVVPTGTSVVTGEGIPGSKISIATDTTTATTATADVSGDGTWTVELDAPLAPGAHSMTVTETPYWESLAPITSTRSFTVTEDGDEGETPAPVAPVAVTNPTDPAAGYARNQAFTFEGTGQPESIITVENKFGTHLATTTVTEQGTWSWTRANMGTSTWHLHFIQDKNQPGSTTAKVLGFAPAALTTTPVAVTNPTDPTTGYIRNQAFTFEGTGQPRSTITVENKFGTHIATTTVTEQGTWSWTRANMGTSTWHLHFIQDEGQSSSTVASILGFAPRA